MTHTDDLEQLDFLLAAQYAIECAFMPCVVCATETPHRLLGTMDDALEIYRCGVCGTTDSRLNLRKEITTRYDNDPTPVP